MTPEVSDSERLGWRMSDGYDGEERQVKNKGKGYVPETAHSAVAATWVRVKTAPAINATMMMLDSLSLPVWNVVSQ